MATTRSVKIRGNGVSLDGDLVLPEDARGIVIFAHGSGSSRFSPRNRYVSEVLHRAGLGTLLLDLLTPDEERIDDVTRELRFDIPLLAGRLVHAAEWAHAQPDLAHLAIGYFGASTGAAAALIAAAQRPELASAVVSRGGRADLAGTALPHVQAPVLLIVGSRDDVVIELNEQAYERLRGTKRLEIVERAGHLFEEPGTLSQVAALAATWFATHLGEKTTRAAA